MIVFLLATVLLLLGLSSVIIINFSKMNYWSRRNIVGPRPNLIFGNIKESVLRRKHYATVYHEIYKNFPEEKVIGIYTMMSPALLIRDLKIVKQILIKDFNCFSERGIMLNKEKIGDSLFHCDINTWRALSGEFSGPFSNYKLKNVFNTISKCGETLLHHIENEIRENPVLEMHKLLQKYGMDAMLQGFFDINLEIYTENAGFFDKLDESMFEKSYITELTMQFPGIMGKINKSVFGETVIQFCHDVMKIAAKRDTPAAKNSVMHTLLELKNKKVISAKDNENFKINVTDHVLASQVFILLAAGYKNCDLSLGYGMYYLARNSTIQDILVEEIDYVLSKYHGELTYDALKEMTYLENVFKETLRIMPFANTLQRVAMKDYTIPETNIQIEKGTVVFISPLAIQRDEKYYVDPYKFIPERFSSENVNNLDSSAFLSFGLGPRSCFGKQLAKLLFKVAMIKIFSKYTVRPSKNMKEEEIDPCRHLLEMKGGIHLNIIPRNLKHANNS